MFLIFAVEIILFVKVDRVKPERSRIYVLSLLVYGLGNLALIFSYQLLYRVNAVEVRYNELLLHLVFTLIYMMRCIQFRYFIGFYTVFMIGWILAVIFLAQSFSV